MGKQIEQFAKLESACSALDAPRQKCQKNLSPTRRRSDVIMHLVIAALYLILAIVHACAGLIK
jgi:hypothetical protein